MGEGQEKKLDITIEEQAKETNGLDNPVNNTQSWTNWLGKHKRWVEIVINAFLVLASQSVALVLGRLYYEKGGKSKWMASLVKTIGFPLILPFLWMNKERSNDEGTKHPSTVILVPVYVFLGILMGGGCVCFSIGLLYLHVSTFTIIAASKLVFNALLSFFLNSQKITPLKANSIVLLTISCILLVLQPNDTSTNTGSSKRKHYLIGIICTLTASFGYALLFSLTEITFRKFIRRQTMKHVMNFVVWQSFFATCAILVGLFASGEWKHMKQDMRDFKLAKLSYVMILAWIALSWQVFTIGVLGLIIKVSALFANVISTFVVPLIPVLAHIIFHEKMSGLKVISIFLAIWGFLSYTYQQYLDELQLKADLVNGSGTSEVSSIERG